MGNLEVNELRSQRSQQYIFLQLLSAVANHSGLVVACLLRPKHARIKLCQRQFCIFHKNHCDRQL